MLIDFLKKIKDYLYEKDGVFKLEIFQNKWFLGVLFLKLLFGSLFASDFLVKLFIPFVNFFIQSGFQDPYQYFYIQNILNIFPYPSAMLWFLAIPRFVSSLFLNNVEQIGWFSLLLARLPVLFSDLIIFTILIRWLKNKQQKVLIYYWCSPILFYINYIHGQLDVIPMMLLFVFLYLLFKEKFAKAFVFLGLSFAAKTGIVIVLPFILVYLFLKRIQLLKIFYYLSISLFVFLFLNSPYIFSTGFQQIVFNNHEQFKIFDLNLRVNNSLIIYFVPLTYLILFVKSLTFKTFNRDIFLMFLGFSFGILTLLVPPMQGWYYWIIPFFVYFYIKQENTPNLIFIFLNIFYFAYFILIKNSDFFQVWQVVNPALSSTSNLYNQLFSKGINPDIMVNIIFTLLQGSLLINILWIYRKGIESLIRNKINYKPYLIAVAGDSGSGKSVLTGLLLDKFGKENTLVVAGDDAHRWERGDKNWSKYTHLDPRANKIQFDMEQLVDLRAGRSIQRSFYDHTTGKFTLPVKLYSKKIIIFQGLHSLFVSKMRDFYDLKIYIKPSDDLRLFWKVKRDTKDRGYDVNKVLEQVKQRVNDADKYINPQDVYADVIISFNTDQPAVDYTKKIDELGLYLKIVFENNINMFPFLVELENNDILKLNHYYEGGKQLLEIRGEIAMQEIDKIAYKLIPELWEVVKDDPRWSSGYNGLIQLFIGYYIFEKMKLEHRYEY